MFNFYADLIGHDMATDTGEATKCRNKFKAPSLQTKKTKMKFLPKTWVLTENNLKVQTKKKQTSSLNQTTPWNTRPLNA